MPQFPGNRTFELKLRVQFEEIKEFGSRTVIEERVYFELRLPNGKWVSLGNQWELNEVSKLIAENIVQPPEIKRNRPMEDYIKAVEDLGGIDVSSRQVADYLGIALDRSAQALLRACAYGSLNRRKPHGRYLYTIVQE